MPFPDLPLTCSSAEDRDHRLLLVSLEPNKAALLVASFREQTLGFATRQIKQPSACMELLCHKRNLIQEQQPFSSLKGLQNPLEEEFAALALDTQFPAHEKKGCSLALL